jgi:hypothetical protein
LAGFIDDPDFPDSDPLVDAGAIVTSWAAVESDKDLLESLPGALDLQVRRVAGRT